MARVLRLYDQEVDVLCPHCGEEITVEVNRVAVTSTKLDGSWSEKETENNVECPICDGPFAIHLHADIETSV